MSGADNPWLSGGAAQEVDDIGAAAAAFSGAPASTGPLAPQPAVPVPDAVDRLPWRAVPATVPLWWVGVHGGAGETTLARLLPGSRDAGHAWPQPAETGQRPAKVVLVARSDVRGLTAAQRAATEWASRAVDQIDLLGLVITADAPGRLPRALKDLSAVVAGGVPRMWRLPWSEPWRLGDVDEANSPKEVRRLLADVRQLVPVLDAAYRGTN